MTGGGGGSNKFAKTICSICYEDLKPIVEDLQSISICGHVFHELCIQQWFEYCTNGKKKNCPVCKQTCSESSVNRLYFQSVADPNDQSPSQKLHDHEEDPEELRRKVRGLEGKVLGLTSTLECQQKEIKYMNEELGDCKEQLKKEAALKTDALKQTRTIEQLLKLKYQELENSTSECKRLQERSMALAKELAAIKLVSDVNLEEEEILKLASLGAGGNNKETIDVLKKSLIIRNKSYKDLIAKCNVLGRGEARSLNKLEKANEKIMKLKTRIQELETAIEVKDNVALRALRTNKTSFAVNIMNSDSKPSVPMKCSSEDKTRESAILDATLAETGSMQAHLFCPRKIKRRKPSNDVSGSNNQEDMHACGQPKQPYFLIDEEAPDISKLQDSSHFGSTPQASEDTITKISYLPRLEVESEINTVAKQRKLDGVSNSSVNKSQTTTSRPAQSEEDVIILEEGKEDQPLLNIAKENSLPIPIPREGKNCFSGGLLGPDGTKWHLGKWCKRGQSKGLPSLSSVPQKSSASSGDLIAVGADGRGGRIKVLKSLNQSSQDIKEIPTWENKSKYGARTINSRSQGCLQIEHFFGRAGQ